MGWNATARRQQETTPDQPPPRRLRIYVDEEALRRWLTQGTAAQDAADPDEPAEERDDEK